MNFWKRKLDAYLHDPPEKVLDLAWHKRRAEEYAGIHNLEGSDFHSGSDHAAAAADRLPWPMAGYLECAFDGKANHFKHPLGGAELRIAPFQTADLAHELAQKECPYLREGNDMIQFMAYWRFWRWWASDQKDSRLAFLPADTRLPDHTIWSHNSMVSALEGCVEDGVLRPAFLMMQIGPVQEYISQARRTLDLWSGSYLLSYLAGTGLAHLAKEIGPDNVVFPNLCGQPIFDLLLKETVWDQGRTSEANSLWDALGYGTSHGRKRLLTPSLPNRFLAIIPAGADGKRARQMAGEVESAIRGKYQEIAEKVWTFATSKAPEIGNWDKQRFTAQWERFLSIHWQITEWPKTLEEISRFRGELPSPAESAAGNGLDTILEMAKRTPKEQRDVRNFQCERFPKGHRRAGWKDRSKLAEDAELDNPAAGWSALHQLAAWHLDAVRRVRIFEGWNSTGWETGKKQNKDSLNGKEEALLDLSEMDKDEVNALNDRFGIPLFKKGEILGASSLIKRLWPAAYLQERYRFFENSDFRMPDTRNIAEGAPFAQAEDERDLDLEPEEGPGAKYFAVLALDGDEMGKWVSGLHQRMPKLAEQLADYADPGSSERKGAKVYLDRHGMSDLLDRKRPLTPSFHLQFSEMLANFSNYCVRRVVEAHDGRLIYAGGDDVLALLPARTALRCARALRAAFQGDAAMTETLRGVWKGTERIDVPLFQFEQPGFVKIHPNTLGLAGEPKRFPAIVPGPAADCSAGVAIAHFKAPLQDVVRAAQAAEKRAKTKLGRSAAAVTLMKRSGEIIEWGCRWDDGGLPLLEMIQRRMADGSLSGKFPHRVIELLGPYLTEPTDLARMTAAPEFAGNVEEIIQREFLVAVERQCQRKRDLAALSAELEELLGRYLKGSQARFGTDGGLPEEHAEHQLRAMIGVCQTTAFSQRINREKESGLEQEETEKEAAEA